MKDVLRQIYRHAKSSNIDELAPWIAKAMDHYEINTPLRQCHFIAQIGHETGELRYRQEIASGAAYEGRADLGNNQPGDGRRFKGRGSIQCTGRANYTDYDKFLGLDGKLLKHPELVAIDNELWADVGGWYWSKRKLNAYADRDDVRSITMRINGGFNGFRDRVRLLDIAKNVLIAHDADTDDDHSVVGLQRALVRLGYNIAVDGVIGKNTKNAIKTFQTSAGIAPDGIVGPITWAVIEKALRAEN